MVPDWGWQNANLQFLKGTTHRLAGLDFFDSDLLPTARDQPEFGLGLGVASTCTLEFFQDLFELLLDLALVDHVLDAYDRLAELF